MAHPDPAITRALDLRGRVVDLRARVDRDAGCVALGYDAPGGVWLKEEGVHPVATITEHIQKLMTLRTELASVLGMGRLPMIDEPGHPQNRPE